MKYHEWLEDWLENYVKPSVKTHTYETYRRVVLLHIVPNIGTWNINDITPIMLQKLVNKLLKCGNLKTGLGLASGTVNLIITLIQSSLRTAYSVGEIKENIGSKIKRPRIDAKRITCFSIPEQKKLERGILAEGRKKLFGIIICLYCGLRIGELLSLTWDDVDFENNLLTISKTSYEMRTGEGMRHVIDTPKTEQSKRIIPIPKQLMKDLKALRNEQCGKYIVLQDGLPVTVRSYQRSFELLLKKLDIPHKCFHTLRHTFATRALECGMDIKTLSEILGHKNATITLNRYAHSMLEHKYNMMNKLGMLFEEE